MGGSSRPPRALPSAMRGGEGGGGRPGKTGYQTIQTAAGGNRSLGRYLEVTVRGPVAQADDILRAVTLQAGGFIAAARNPIPASYVKQHAAVGAISYALRLGEAMLAAQPLGAEAVIEAAVRETKGHILGRGPVRDARVDTRDS